MPDSLAKLLRLIPSGTTEGELGFLSEVFVLPAELREILSIPQGNPRLLVGRKGTGKTAILEYLHLRLAERGIPSVLLRPDDLPLPNDEFKSVGDAKRRAYAELVLATASAVGKYTTFAKTDAERSLLLAAKQRGERGDDLIEKACKMLIPVGALLADIDFGAWIQDAAVTEHGLVTALRDVLSKETGRFVFVLVDDVDQIGRADTSDYTTRIWGLLLAIRKLASENRAIRAIVALRSEVWMRLEWDGIGGRDQVDHFLPLIHRLSPEQADVERIVLGRLRAADPPGDLTQFFEGADVRLPGSHETRKWMDFLAKNSRGRPRDALQLVRQLAARAISRRSPRITSVDVEAEISGYSRKRVDLLSEEFAFDCPVLQDLIRSFQSLAFVESSQHVFDHLQKLPSQFSVSLRGAVIQPGQRSHVFKLWRFLHETGFINAVVSDDRMPRGFRHINYADDPELASASRWNDIQPVAWEIHPVFRQFLIDEQTASAADMGLSPEELRRQRRPSKT